VLGIATRLLGVGFGDLIFGFWKNSHVAVTTALNRLSLNSSSGTDRPKRAR
jgi:hypothetical protein